MLDIVKRILNLTGDDSDLLVEVERPEKVEMSKEEVYEMLFQELETAQKENKNVYFRLYKYLDTDLIVKANGLFAHLPFDLTPWHYPHSHYWKYVIPTAMGGRYRCKVVETSREANPHFSIHVDATVHELHEAELVENAEYKGIVLEIFDDRLLVDIGLHFRWKYGALMGYMPISKNVDLTIEAGEKIKVKYTGKDERYLQFAPMEDVDFASYIGNAVWVQVCKAEGTAPYYMVEGKYRAEMPVTRTVYPEKKRKMQRLKGQWQNGDIVNCEVIDYKPHRGLIVKCIDEAWLFEINWCSDEMIDYIGKEVPVHVHKSEEDGVSYLIDNLYTAKFPTGVKTRNLDKLNDGDVIICKVYSIDTVQQYFRVRWVDTDKHKEENAEESV
ncbi:MAG: hypothetical protein LBH19_04980 [Dysgonamonadaceae bacterium]|jgi:hypothetical protein|nr:hypothetical protein [Dysgonamonadaceae bacterium]